MRWFRQKEKYRQFNEVFKTTKAAVDEKIALAILINRGSASAAEIVAGAVQDLDRGIIVGQRSLWKRTCSGNQTAKLQYPA